jgi:hypothetical protein
MLFSFALLLCFARDLSKLGNSHQFRVQVSNAHISLSFACIVLKFYNPILRTTLLVSDTSNHPKFKKLKFFFLQTPLYPRMAVADAGRGILV